MNYITPPAPPHPPTHPPPASPSMYSLGFSHACLVVCCLQAHASQAHHTILRCDKYIENETRVLKQIICLRQMFWLLPPNHLFETRVPPNHLFETRVDKCFGGPAAPNALAAPAAPAAPAALAFLFTKGFLVTKGFLLTKGFLCTKGLLVTKIFFAVWGYLGAFGRNLRRFGDPSGPFGRQLGVFWRNFASFGHDSLGGWIFPLKENKIGPPRNRGLGFILAYFYCHLEAMSVLEDLRSKSFLLRGEGSSGSRGSSGYGGSRNPEQGRGTALVAKSFVHMVADPAALEPHRPLSLEHSLRRACEPIQGPTCRKQFPANVFAIELSQLRVWMGVAMKAHAVFKTSLSSTNPLY